ncbi:hypothetical protein O0L34_g2478 [Tuta absoluta]|nr:hypothetical protein O0L34_g2478 [Tuta absoluta]
MEVGSLVVTIKMLMELRSWLKGNNMMIVLIDKLIQEKTDLTPDQLDRYTNKVYSGLLTHRLPCPALRRGGMLNMNSTICSWLRVISDTALHYAKQSTNYNLCWQEIFLTGIARLANLYDEAQTLMPRYAIILSAKCCIWELPPETFELGLSVYQPLMHTSYLHELTPTDEHHLVDPTGVTDPVTSYSIHMAHKFAAWILHQSKEEFISSLENRAVEETFRASFVNLTEFRHCRLDVMLPTMLFYLMLYDRDFLRLSASRLDDILITSRKTPYDVLLDTIHSCGKSWELYTIAKMAPPSNREEARYALYSILTTTLDQGYDELMTRYAVLTPDNAARLLHRLIHIHNMLHGSEYVNTYEMTYDELMESAERSQPPLHVKVCLSEEDAIAYVRQAQTETRPIAQHYAPVNDGELDIEDGHVFYYPPHLNLLSNITSLSTANASCLEGLARFENFGILQPSVIITLNDRQGELADALWHLFNVPVCPVWDLTDDDRHVWEEGPLVPSSDPCRPNVDMTLFLSLISKQLPHALMRLPDLNNFMVVCSPTV